MTNLLEKKNNELTEKLNGASIWTLFKNIIVYPVSFVKNYTVISIFAISNSNFCNSRKIDNVV